MSENPSEQEPSIEEILASIRQIISDDDEEETQEEQVEEAAAPEPEPEPEPDPEPEPEPEEEDDILDLTEAEMVDEEEEEEEEFVPDIAMQDIEEEEEEDLDKAAEKYAAEPFPEDFDIISDDTKAAALSSISKLAGAMPIGRTANYGGVTLEDIVRELLQPMLKEWTDDNLAEMVERIVEQELRKLARRAMDE